MMRKFLFAALVAVLISFSLADTSNFVFRSRWTSPLDIDELCESVGDYSGCSGCVLGTKGLCAWVAVESNNGKKRELGFRDVEVEYECVPREDLPDLLDQEDPEYFLADTLCPADPTKEPISREIYDSSEEATDDNEVRRTSSYLSKWYDTDLAEFPTQPWPVDRTSFYGALGYASGDIESSTHVDCGDLTSKDLVAEHLDDEDGSALFDGRLTTPRDKWCVRLYLAALLTSRCPAYGVAVSGVCESFYQMINKNCYTASQSNIDSETGLYGDDIVFEAFNVVPDETAFCIDSFDMKASGEMESLAGLHIPDWKLEANEDNDSYYYDDN